MKKRKRRGISEKKREQFRALVCSGAKLKDIAKHLRIPLPTAYKLRKKMGLAPYCDNLDILAIRLHKMFGPQLLQNFPRLIAGAVVERIAADASAGDKVDFGYHLLRAIHARYGAGPQSEKWVN